MYSDIILQTFDAFQAQQGANRGIGFSVLRALAARSPSDHCLPAARSTENGQLAIQELRNSGVQAEIDIVESELANRSSIKAAEREIRKQYGRLDILVNNGGVAILERPDGTNIQESYTQTTSHKESSPDARIINISSARASLHLSSTGNLPPSKVISYSVSKTAPNALTILYAKAEPTVTFHAASPAHRKTAFNGFTGTKDPLCGARVVAELALAEREKYENGFWQLEGDEREASQVPW